MHAVPLAELRYADQIDWSRAAADSTTLRALRGGDQPGKTPTDRGRPGTKDHLLTDGGGIPLAAHATAANRHDVTQLKTLVEEAQPVAGQLGRPSANPRPCWQTVLMTASRTGNGSGPKASSRSWPSVGRNMAAA